MTESGRKTRIKQFCSLVLLAAIGLTGCQEAGPRPTQQQAQAESSVATPGTGGKISRTDPSSRGGYERTGRVIRNTDDSSGTDGRESTTEDTTRVEKEDVVQLSWDAPTHRENGEGLYPAEIREYIISYGRKRERLRFSVTVDSDGTRSMQHSIEGLDEGTWYFTVQTVDLANNISQKADVVSKSL